MPFELMTRFTSRAVAIVIAAIALCAGSAAIAQTPCNDCGQVVSVRESQRRCGDEGVATMPKLLAPFVRSMAPASSWFETRRMYRPPGALLGIVQSSHQFGLFVKFVELGLNV